MDRLGGLLAYHHVIPNPAHKGCQMRRTMGRLAVTMLMAMLAAGCGSSDEEPSAGAPATTAAPVTTITTSSATATSTTATSSATAARCSNGVLLQAAQKALRDSGSTVTIASVTVTRCRNGYALLSAHPAAGNVESPNVFLVWKPDTEAWEPLDLGTGIDCAGSPIGPELTKACKALGYPVGG
jgi:hypothetical protein